MKKITTFFLLIFFVAVSVFAQEAAIDKYYIGSLLTLGADGYTTDNAITDLNVYSALSANIDLNDYMRLKSIIVYQPTKDYFSTDVRLIGGITDQLFVSAGYMQTLTRDLNTPPQVSDAAQFTPPSINAISPGSRIGVMVNTSNLYGGAYINNEDTVEIHAGLTFSPWFISKLSVAGYVLNHETADGQQIYGGSATIEIGRFSLTAYGDNSRDEFSGVLGINLGDSWSSYTTVLKKGDQWQHTETGILKATKSEVQGVEVNYLYGFGWQVDPIVAGFFYLQIWLD